jgi:hypothetical protein
LRLLLAAAVVAAPASADADLDISIRPADEAPVELLRPADHEVLEGGRESTVAWRALRDLASEGIHEWEAFLSFDGGHTWPVRVTPHLDIGLSSFRFVVPAIPSDDVRLMLRFGDERRELGYILPVVLRSVLPRNGWLPTPLPAPSFGRGEAARPGVPGVVLWVEAGRNGRRAEVRAATWDRPGLRRARVARLPLWLLPAAPWTPVPGCAAPEHSAHPSSAVGRLRSPIGRALWSFPLLLLLCRQNE